MSPKRRRIDHSLTHLTERQYQNRIESLAHQLGFETCHVNRGQVANGRFITPTSSKGFPDLWCVGHGWLLVFEVKKEDAPPAKFKPEQRTWIRLLQQVPGVEAYMVRPSDWGHVEQLLREAAATTRARTD